MNSRLLNFARRERSPLTNAYIAIAVSMVIASFAAPLIRLAQEGGAPSPFIVTGRLGFAALLLTPLVLRRYRGQLSRLTRRDIFLAVAAGVWINIHFTLMAFALESTSVMVAQVIVNSSPLWVALLEMLFLRARLSRLVWIGLLITLIGGTIIGVGGAEQQQTPHLGIPDEAAIVTAQAAEDNSLIGVMLTVASAIAAAIYLTIGRKARAKVSIIPYMWMLCSSGAITGIGVMLVLGTSLSSMTGGGLLWIILLTLGPQLIAHSCVNFAVGYMPATVVSLSSQMVSVTATVIAFLLFAEVPGLLEILGGVIIIAGVSLAILDQRNQHQRKKKAAAVEAAIEPAPIPPTEPTEEKRKAIPDV